MTLADALHCSSTPLHAITKTELKKASKDDAVLKSVSKDMMSGWPTKRQLTPELQPYFVLQHELSVVDDCVMRGDRFVIPAALQSELISIAHQGHPGIVRIKQRLGECYWWPGMDRMIEQQVGH